MTVVDELQTRRNHHIPIAGSNWRRAILLRHLYCRSTDFRANPGSSFIFNEGRSMSDLRIDGTCDARFTLVKDAFAENLEKRNEYGAAVAVTIDGRMVVDLWGGYADKARTRAWRRDTLANVFSTTK